MSHERKINVVYVRVNTETADAARAGRQLAIRSFGPGDTSTASVSLGSATGDVAARPTMVPTDHDDLHALTWFSDPVGDAELQTVVLGPDGVVAVAVPLGEAPMAAYRPSVAYRSGRLAVGWVEKDDDLQFRIQAAVFGAD